MGLDEIYVRDKSLTRIGLIENAESVIWTSRYFECGDFEIYAKADKQILSLCKSGMFLTHKDSDMVGMIEEYKITTDLDGIDYITISGRCATGLLARRAIRKTLSTESEYVQAGPVIRALIERNIVNDTVYPLRNISILKLDENGFEIYGNSVSTQWGEFKGTVLYKTVTDICKDAGCGIKTVLDESDSENPKLVIKLYEGVDRTKNQSNVTKVIFSPENDNLMESEFVVSWTNYANGALTLANGNDKEQVEYRYHLGAGLSLFEIPVNATDVLMKDNPKYSDTIHSRWRETLANHKLNVAFDGKAGFSELFKFKRDYNLGDLVTMENNYGMSETLRIIEITECLDTNGYVITPIFKGATGELPW